MRAWTWHTPYSTLHSAPCELGSSEALLHRWDENSLDHSLDHENITSSSEDMRGGS